MSRQAEDLVDREPWEALSEWLHRFVGFVATKRALAEEVPAGDRRHAGWIGVERPPLTCAG